MSEEKEDSWDEGYNSGFDVGYKAGLEAARGTDGGSPIGRAFLLGLSKGRDLGRKEEALDPDPAPE